MKPIRLELEGFTAFRERTVLDFEGRTLFAITGPTGAGKSSLLDAITWSLYGMVPRVGSQTRQLVSQGARQMQVMFDFSTGGRIHRVVRKAPASVGTRLEEQLADGSWRPLADRARDVTDEVGRLLGMDYVTFTRTMVLPQGEGAAFLSGDAAARRRILTGLIGLSVYEEARRLANDRSKRSGERAQTITAQLGRLSLASPERLAELRKEATTLAAELSLLQARRVALTELADCWRSWSAVRGAATEAGEATGQAAAEAAAEEQALEAAGAALAGEEARSEGLAREIGELAYDASEHEQLRREAEQLEMRSAAADDLERARARARELARDVAAAERAEEDAQARLRAALAAHGEALAGREARGSSLQTVAARADLDLERLRGEARAEAQVAEAAREEAGEQQALAERLEGLRRELAQLVLGEESAVRELAQWRGEGERLSARAEDSGRALQDAAKLLRAREAERERARAADQAAALRIDLAVGDLCPVCGEPITRLPDTPPVGELSRTGQAVLEAEAEVTRRRREEQEARSHLAAARARIEASEVGQQQALDQLAELDGRLSGLGTERSQLGAAAAGAARAADRARELAARAGESGELAAARTQELAVALARVPDEFLAGEPPVAVAEPIDPEVLAVAVTDYQEAERAIRGADDGARQRSTELDAARAGRQRLGDLAVVAEEAAAKAESRLVALGELPAGASAEEIGARLGRAQLDAERDRGLREEQARSGVEVARLAATRDGARASLERAGATLLAAGERETAALLKLGEARAALETSWAATIDGEDEPTFEHLQQVMTAHEQEQDRANGRRGEVAALVEQAERDAAEAERMSGEAAGQQREADLNRELGRELQGNHFIAYVQREAMHLLAGDATHRFREFSNGRYELVAEDAEFAVVDRLNGDERRSVKTLSGGESFLASLALALALSEHLPQLASLGGAVSLESLFIDEGFGALDAESLDLAVQGLETLAGGQRMVGVISHVEALAQRLPDRVEVIKQGNSSTVRG